MLTFIQWSTYFALSFCNISSVNDYGFGNCSQVGIDDQDEWFQVVEIDTIYSGVKNSFHTLLHILGKYHEHQRPDRDQYIRIEWKNIREGMYKCLHSIIKIPSEYVHSLYVT